MRELARTWALLTGLISAAALLAAPGAFASHDAACQLLGTSGQRPKSVACNPRQNCFNGEDHVRKLAAGALANTKEQNPLWLYHELRHTEQCAEWGGREFYAAQWFKDFNLAVVQTQLQANPQAFMNDVHDKQGMEVDANARMRVVEKALPDGLSARGTAGRR